MGSYVFIFYAALDVTMSILVFLFVKETKGRSLEEMETIFHSAAAFDVDAARKRGSVSDGPARLEEVNVHDGKFFESD